MEEREECSADAAITDEQSQYSCKSNDEDINCCLLEETLSNSDNLEVESGVESAIGDVAEGELLELGDENLLSLYLGDLDLTTEQARETLKYFTLASDRTSQMTKTHNDLDAILQLLQEKEKDLELAARIGQSLLERNKQLLVKTQAFENFVAECDEKETQLQHEVTMKNDLLQKFLKDQELDEFYQLTNRLDEESRSSDGSCKDDSINSLQRKCDNLEKQNTHLILEALQLKEETASTEMKEQQLVLDCVNQLVEAKDQISDLTDEISRKAEDNIRQQEEITHLINTVVDLQNRHKQLSVDNEDLQGLLNSSQVNQNQLKDKVEDLQDKYHECLEMLMENQREVKRLTSKIEADRGPGKKSYPSHPSVYDSRDSIALEIEESVKRDLSSQQEKREHTARVMKTVRAINTGRSSTRPKKQSSHQRQKASTTNNGPKSLVNQSDDSSEESGGTMADSRPGSSVQERRLSYVRRPFRAPEKLQIVKPIKGSVTLHQWKKLANPTLNLADERPGVHVQGQSADVEGTAETARERRESSDFDPDDHEFEEDEAIYMNISRTDSSSEASGAKQEEIGNERLEKAALSKGSEKEGSLNPPPAKTLPQNLGLMSLVGGPGLKKGVRDGGGILTHLLNSPSTSSPGNSSIGRVLADVLNKASKEASEKEPSRAESLRNLAKYFSEKEQGSNTSLDKVKSPPTITSQVITIPKTTSPGGGTLLSKIIGSSGISAGMSMPASITTTAKTDGIATTTNSTSTSPSILTRSSLVRNSSGSNLLSLAQGAMADDASKRHSLDSSHLLKNTADTMDSSQGLDFSQLKFPTLRRRASSGDLQEMASSSSTLDEFGSTGLGARLYRSSSIGNMKDLSNDSLSGPSKDVSEGGFFGRLRRTPSIGSLTNLVQRSNLSASFPNTLDGSRQRSTSLESLPVFKPGESPPSPSKFDNDSPNFFGRKNAPSSSVDTLSVASTGVGFPIGARLSGFSGVRGAWAQSGSKSVEMPTPPAVPQQAPLPKSEERLDKINKAFAFEDFGGLGLMSFFGRKSRDNR